MRLRQVHKIVTEELPHLKGITLQQIGNSTSYKIDRYSEAIDCLQRLNQLGFLDDTLNKLAEKKLMIIGTNAIQVNENYGNIFLQILNETIYKCQAVLKIIEKHVPEEKENNVLINIPQYSSLNEFVAMQNSLVKSFKLLAVLPNFKETPSFSNFDVGTDWLSISFNSLEAVVNFIEIISAISKFKRSHISKRLDNLTLSQLKLKPETKQEVNKAIRDQAFEAYEAIAKSIIKDDNLTNKGEDISKLSEAMQNLAAIMDSGVSFHPSLNANNEVQKKFISTDKQNLLPEAGEKASRMFLEENNQKNQQ